MDILSQAIIKLLKEERFYGELILGMDKIYTRSLPTAGVCIKENIQLYVNPDFFQSLTDDEQVAVLKHECGHILNDHIGRMKELAPEAYDKSVAVEDKVINSLKHKVLNIAADLSLNTNIKNLPKDCCLPAQFKLEEGQILEWYFQNLKNNDKLKELQEFDDHSIWAESEDQRDILKEKVRKFVNDAANKTRACGRMSADDELLVDRLNRRAKDWKQELRRFAAHALQIKIESSRKKRNRRYGIAVPGVIKEEILHIGVAIDTSGSISDEALSQFMAEIANIAKYAQVTVVEADSEVKNAYVFDPKKTYRIKGRGGTAYQPALDYFTTETEVDGVIYFGDMDCFDNEDIKKPKYPVLWAIVGQQSPPVEWGSRINIEIQEKK